MHSCQTKFFIGCLFIGQTSFSAFAEDNIDDRPQCKVVPPQYITLDNPQNIGFDDIQIESKKTVINKDRNTRFIGAVKLSSQKNTVQADEIIIDRVDGSIESKGKTRFQTPSITIDAANLKGNNKQNKLIMTDSKYRLNDAPGKGSAEQLKISQKRVVLTDSTYTSCIDDKPDWEISATEISLSNENNEGEAWNSIFRVKDIPVFYLPYFNFPLTDERKTGFLYPKISSSNKHGFKFSIPFYWNIAPNLDATITPYYMSKRGTQLQTEVRYLFDQQFSQLNIEYLDKDKEISNNDDERYLTRFQHIGSFADNYRVHIDWNDISDDNYLVDFDSEQFNESDAYLWRLGELSYFSNYWDVTFKLQDFYVLGDNQDSYETLPQIEFNSYQPLNFYNSSFDVYAEYSHFDISDDALPTADRLHLEAGFNIPYSQPGWFVNSEMSVLHTIYKQDNIDNINYNNPEIRLEEDVSRTLPKFRVHTGLTFDRDTSLLFENLSQTFEPQVQYLYIPDKNQDDIFIYDTSALQDDFDGLFRDRRFSSVDRIAEANQLSVGATSRLLNSENKELFHLSVGRIFYLNDTNISFNEEGDSENSSSLAADVFIQLAQRWQLEGDLQYDTKKEETDKSQISINYRHDDRNLFQLSHRYISNLADTDIEQITALGSFPINKDWQFVGRFTRDLTRKRSLESYAGVQYESCCWAVRLTYERNINTNLYDQDFVNENRDEFDSGFMIQFVLKGLGGKQKPISIDDMLESGLFGYKRPYFLSN